MKKHNVFPLVVGLAFAAGSVTNVQACDVCNSQIPYFPANAGQLSYMFFNLSGSNCTLTPYFQSANPNAYSSFAQSNGWGNPDIEISKKTPAIAAFFNTYGLGGSASSPSATVTNSVIYFNNGDPLNETPVKNLMNGNASLPMPLNGSWGGFNDNQIYEPSTGLGPASGNESINTPAMGDSWTLACGSQNIVIANIASSSPYLYSGFPTAYPYEGSVPTDFLDNATINPPAESSTPSTPCSVGDEGGEYDYFPNNPCGAGFTAEYQSTGNGIYNWNVQTTAPNYQQTGGLWSGIYYDGMTNSYPASLLLNAPMLPINLSSYIGLKYSPTISASYAYTPVFGGDFTLAVGDPFVVSSFAAKALWYIVANQPISSNITTISSLQSTLSNANSGVFSENSVADTYIQWLVGSQSSTQNALGAPQVAANAFMSSYLAVLNYADNPKTSIWGKIFAGLADVTVKAINKAVMTLVPEASVTGIVISSASSTAGGILIPDMNAAIENAFTTNTSSPPMSQTAPIILNPSYGSSNLMGLFLTNSVVSACINNLLGSVYDDGGTYKQEYTSCTSAFLDFVQNYSISTSTPAECDSPGVLNNLLTGYCNNSSGASTCNGSSCKSSPSQYTNVYSATQSTTAMSIWDAILTGSDVTTNEEGYMVLGNTVGNAVSFTPPTTMWNASSSSSLPQNLAVNTTFNLNTATITASGYSMPITPSSTFNSPAPSATPQTIYALTNKPPPGVEYDGLSSYGISYNQTDGILTISGYTTNGIGYDFSNGPQTIDMTQCPIDSAAMVFVTAAANSDASGASGSVQCDYINTATTEPTLSYNNCVGDPNASGGVIAAFTSAPNTTTGEGGVVELACACIPDYIGGPANGPTTLGNVVVGATSSNPTLKCPAPAS